MALIEERAAHDRYQHGTYSFAYVLEGSVRAPNQAELVQLLERIEGAETGWPMWAVIRRDALRPRAVDGLAEAFFLDTMFADPSHSDFWRAAPEGKLFLIRGYEEDGGEGRSEPGSTLDLTLPVWRVGEALLHASRLAHELGDDEVTVHFRARWDGLEGRNLRSLFARRLLSHGRQAAQDVVTSSISIRADEIGQGLVQAVESLTQPLYVVFDFFQPPTRMIAEELDELRGRRRR